mgnify:CR=1 FL=1
MDFDQLYHFVFETYEGIGISIVVCLLLCIALAAIMERQTRKRFVDRLRRDLACAHRRDDRRGAGDRVAADIDALARGEAVLADNDASV